MHNSIYVRLGIKQAAQSQKENGSTMKNTYTKRMRRDLGVSAVHPPQYGYITNSLRSRDDIGKQKCKFTRMHTLI
ncbi:hypothetical protein GDO81_022763 [Engystomops pustulosus]|uniref:Uncharacterized protein n=1 Tax=Engystomops pustulosus TaxID=76066 RepID=A0AAV6YLS2_ENGPU|nr:hypothetical protein GDO81_022763 [Engystomops pustulosus]